MTDPSSDESRSGSRPDWLGGLRAQSRLFLLEYELGVRDVGTKIAILPDELLHVQDNPIGQVTTRA